MKNVLDKIASINPTPHAIAACVELLVLGALFSGYWVNGHYGAIIGYVLVIVPIAVIVHFACIGAHLTKLNQTRDSRAVMLSLAIAAASIALGIGLSVIVIILSVKAGAALECATETGAAHESCVNSVIAA